MTSTSRILDNLDPTSQQRIDTLLAVARDFGQRGWTPATSGNYSVRLEDDCVVVTRSGADKRQLVVDDLLLLDPDGNPAEGMRSSAETPLHLQIYRHKPQVKAVLHVHSPAVTVASRLAAAEGSIGLHNYELLKALSGVTSHEERIVLPVVANDQDMTGLAASADAFLGSSDLCPAYLIEGHGIYVWGEDVADAARHLEAIEFLLNCHLLERNARL